MATKEAPPKLFISYSWTTPDHEAWVLELATELRESGVDVILDKWDLREGHDGHVFMEQMVTAPEIKKVILICDKGYVGKADKRAGGVGTETQIITPEIYKKQAQEKFVAVVAERDEDGEAYIPAFYGSRIFIDLSDSERRADSFDQLLRWIFDRPLHKKPPVGKKPTFLADEERAVVLATSSRFRRAVEAIRNNRPRALAAVVEYFEVLTAEFEQLRIETKSGDEFDDLVIRSIESFLPYRNEAITLFLLLARNSNTEETAGVVHRFLERLIPFMERPMNLQSYREWDFDNFKFIVHELYLYAAACFIRHERFDTAAALMNMHYYLPDHLAGDSNPMVPFRMFWRFLHSLEHRNERLALRRSSLRADLLQQRSRESGLEFRDLMQADFVLFLRDRLDRPKATLHWWPETLLYACRQPGAFEIFARSQSARYFERIKPLLRIRDKEDLAALLEGFNENRQMLPQWGFGSFSPQCLLGYQRIATVA